MFLNPQFLECTVGFKCLTPTIPGVVDRMSGKYRFQRQTGHWNDNYISKEQAPCLCQLVAK